MSDKGLGSILPTSDITGVGLGPELEGSGGGQGQTVLEKEELKNSES